MILQEKVPFQLGWFKLKVTENSAKMIKARGTFSLQNWKRKVSGLLSISAAPVRSWGLSALGPALYGSTFRPRPLPCCALRGCPCKLCYTLSQSHFGFSWFSLGGNSSLRSPQRAFLPCHWPTLSHHPSLNRPSAWGWGEPKNSLWGISHSIYC